MSDIIINSNIKQKNVNVIFYVNTELQINDVYTNTNNLNSLITARAVKINKTVKY